MEDHSNSSEQLLNYTSFFEVLDKIEIKTILSIMNRRNFTAGDTIFSESQPAESLFVLEKGNVTLTIPGSRTIFVETGGMFGEIAIINDSARLGTAISKSNSQVLELNANSLYDASIITPSIALKIMKIIAKKHSSVNLRRSEISTLDLIKGGESATVEFKSTLRTNTHTRESDDRIQLAALKTVAAFLNSFGGTLFIGVNDDGVPTGIEVDKYQNDDKYLLFFASLIRDKIGQETIGNVYYEIIILSDKKVLRVDIKASSTPIFVTYQNNEFFYVRSGPSTLSLKHSEFLNYYKKHF